MKGFNSLELFFKKDFVSKNATLLISTIYFQYTVELYSWNNFLIEHYYDNVQKKVIMISLARNADLKKYMKEISISALGLLTQP